MMEEAAERELAHLRESNTCMPGLGSNCGDVHQPGVPAEDGEEAAQQSAPGPGAGQPAGGGASSGGGSGGGAGAGPSPTVPGEPNCFMLVEGTSTAAQDQPRRWCIRLSHAPSPAVGGPARPAAASVGGEAQDGSGSASAGQQQHQQQPASPKRQRKPRQQLQAGDVSLPAPEVAAPAAQPPRTDAAAVARWQEVPPLAPPLGAAPGAGAAGVGPVGGSNGIIYADAPSQQLLVGQEGAAATAERAAPQYRQLPEVLRLFSDDPPGARFSHPAAASLDVIFRASMPGAWNWRVSSSSGGGGAGMLMG